MTALILIGAFALLGATATALALRNDGYGPVRTDWTRLP